MTFTIQTVKKSDYTRWTTWSWTWNYWYVKRHAIGFRLLGVEFNLGNWRSW